MILKIKVCTNKKVTKIFCSRILTNAVPRRITILEIIVTKQTHTYTMTRDCYLPSI